MKILLAIFVGCLICSSAAATMIYFSWADVSEFLGLSKKEEASPAPVFSPPSNTCVPYTKETRCTSSLLGCPRDAKPRSAGWYMMAETRQCEEKFDDGCNYPICAPATNFKTRAECETTCI